MTRGDRERLQDIKDAIVAIGEHIERARAQLGGLDEPLLRDALLYQFVVIGEAVKHVAEETREHAPRSRGKRCIR